MAGETAGAEFDDDTSRPAHSFLLQPATDLTVNSCIKTKLMAGCKPPFVNVGDKAPILFDIFKEMN